MSTSSDLLLERVRSATEDEYTIEGELGRGGMAAVFLARDIALERRVAIKVMLPDLIDVEGIQDRFVIEARTAAHLDHPGIVTVYSVKQRAGLLFIVMKYIQGRTLESVMRDEQALDQSVVTTLVSQVADALHFAHGEGVIHRDVKPSNIILDTRGRPVVTDFGIAKITSGKSITVTGSMLGTPAYMSPEQCRGLPATAASDQYSLGIMTYEMVARRLPFDGTIFELINAHCNEPPPPLRELVKDVDPVLEETIMRMLAKSPRDRWPALSDVSKALTSTGVYHRRSVEVQANIAALVRSADHAAAPRRGAAGIESSNAATELATTPAPALVVTPEDPSIEVGATVQLRVSESSGASLGGFKISWKSEDPTIATVDENGLVTARSVGFAKITASGGAAFGRVAVTVKAPNVDTLVVTPQSPEIVVENEVQFVATALDARGLTLMGQQIVWQSSDVAVCAVSGQGRAIGIAPGKATITAICGKVKGTAQAKVRLPTVDRVVIEPGEVSVEADETRRLTAIVFGPNDRQLTGRALAWRSTVPTVVSVDADGTIKGVSPGTAAVIAKCDGKEGLVSVSVRSQPVVAVRIQPERLQLEIGRSLQLKGVSEDRRGRAVGEKSIEWQSDDEQVALVDASGKVHAVREGRTHVRAIAGDVTSSIEVTIVPRPAVQIRIDSHQPTLAVGAFLSLDAIVLDADGATLPGREITWSSSDPNVIEVTGSGSCEAKKPGSVRITAVCDRARATTKLNALSAAGVAAGAAAAAAAPTVEINAVGRDRAPAPAQRKRNMMVPAGSVAGILLVGGIAWFALRGHGGAAPVSPPPVPAPAPTAADSSKSAVVQRPVDPTPTSPSPVTKAPVTPPPERKAEVPPKPQTPPPSSGTSKQGTAQGTTQGGSKPPVTNPPVTNPVTPPVTPPARSGAPPVRPDTVVSAPPPVVTPPVTPPTPPPSRSGVSADNANHALLCTNQSTPAATLTEAFGRDPLSALTALYQPRDAADTKAKAQMLSELKDVTNLRATVQTGANEPAGDACDWVMTLAFNWTNSFGAPRGKTWQVRLRLEAVAGAAHVKQIFAAKAK